MVFVFLGSCMHVELVWQLADTFNGLMVLPNLVGLLVLAPIVKKRYDEFQSGKYDKIMNDINL